MKKWGSISLFLILLLVSSGLLAYLILNYVEIKRDATKNEEIISYYELSISDMKRKTIDLEIEIKDLKKDNQEKIELYEKWEKWVEEIKPYLNQTT